MDGRVLLVLLVAGVLVAVVFVYGGSLGVPSFSPQPTVSVNSSNYSTPVNSSCFGYPDFAGGGSSRQGQDCTGDGEFSDNYFCLNYPPRDAGDYAKNLSLYCVLDGVQKGECCV